MLEQLRFFTWQDVLLAVVDIAVVAYLFYKIFTLIRGTRAVQLLKGVAFLYVLVSLTQWARLYTINWILVQVRTMLLVALPIVFHPELRRGLEQIGRGRWFTRSLFRFQDDDVEKTVDELVTACFNLSAQKTGGLIVLERETGLEEYMEDAVRIDGLVSSQLYREYFRVWEPSSRRSRHCKRRQDCRSCKLPSADPGPRNGGAGFQAQGSLGHHPGV